jgi:tRNA pseudouridine55 synthase
MTVINKDTIHTNNHVSTDNLIFVDKPEGWSSFDVVNKVRCIGHFKKVGHAGTLDPFASGLLILGTEKNTRLLSDISNNDKTYIAKITFGAKTDTYDITGKIIEKKEIVNFDIQKIKDILYLFTGETEQIAPMYSAKKVNGTRLYKMARKGKNIIRKPHKVIIYEFKLLSYDKNECDFYIKCSKGTYIRSLANDLGLKTGYLAYLKELRRIKINGYSVDKAISVKEFEKYWVSLN